MVSASHKYGKRGPGAWLLPATRRIQPVLTATAWLLCVGSCRAGLAAAGFQADDIWYALVLGGVQLALALGCAAPTSWADRLAQWRRSRERIASELRIGDGLIPWVLTTIPRALAGHAERPAASLFDHAITALAHNEQHLRRTAIQLGLPDVVRELLHTAAHAVGTRAEASAAELTIAIERHALDQAARCRDSIAALGDLADADRARLARDCESLLLDLSTVSVERSRL